MPEQRGLVLVYFRDWRRYVALTQAEVAAKSGVGMSTVVRADGGEPISIPKARKLAEALGVSVQQLQIQAPPIVSEAR